MSAGKQSEACHLDGSTEGGGRKSRQNPQRRQPGNRRQLFSSRGRFQFLDLLQVSGTVTGHPLDKIGNGHWALHFRMEGGLGKVGRLQRSQQAQIMMPSQTVKGEQF